MVRCLQTSLKARFRGIFVNVRMETAAPDERQPLPFADPLYFIAAVLDPEYAMMWLQQDVLVNNDVKREVVDMVKG